MPGIEMVPNDATEHLDPAVPECDICLQIVQLLKSILFHLCLI